MTDLTARAGGENNRRRGGPPPAKLMPQFPGGIVDPESYIEPAFIMPAEPAVIDPATLFDRSAPIAVELGSGKGRFVIDAAIRRPEMNFIAVEYVNKYFKTIVSRAAHRGLSNVRVVRDDARHFIIDALPDASIAECHIYHPDPWPKTRHHKRRLVRPRFLLALHRVLAPGGLLVFQTDHNELWDYSLRAIRHYFNATVLDAPWPDAPLGRTNYEIKALQAGWTVNRLTATPRTDPPDAAKTETLERQLESKGEE